MPMKYENIMNSTVDDKYHLMISSINTNHQYQSKKGNCPFKI